MPELTASQEEALALFTSGADRLEMAVAGLSEKELDCSVAAGEWSIRQIVHHVAEDGDAWSMAFKKTIATPGAPIRFEGFPGNDAWADALAFDKRPVQTALALLKSHRQVIAELAVLFPDAWEQYVTIVDPQGQEVQNVSGGQIIRMLGEHLAEHVATIEAIKKQRGI
jgi:hypothetical protein